MEKRKNDRKGKRFTIIIKVMEIIYKYIIFNISRNEKNDKLEKWWKNCIIAKTSDRKESIVRKEKKICRYCWIRYRWLINYFIKIHKKKYNLKRLKRKRK